MDTVTLETGITERKRAKPGPKPSGRLALITLNLDGGDMQEMDALLAGTGRSRSNVIRELVKDWLRKERRRKTNGV